MKSSHSHVAMSEHLYEETGFLRILLLISHSSIISFAKRLDGCHGQILIDWTDEGSLEMRDGSFRWIKGNNLDSLETTTHSERMKMNEST